MDLLVRGKYVITDAEARDDGILTDGAAYLYGGRIIEVGDYEQLREKHPGATIKGNGKQLLMPGLVDGHSHGSGLTFVQKGIPFDFLENNLLDWAFEIELEPELEAKLCAVRHLRNGCTTIHSNNSMEEPGSITKADKMINGFREVGIRLAYSPGGRDINRLALNDTDFFATLPQDLQTFARPMVFFDKEAFVDTYFEIFEHLYGKYNSEDVRIFFGPSWATGSTDAFLQRIKERADELGKLQIHMHTLQTPIQRAFALKKYGKSQLAHLDDIGLVDENLTLGHAVHLTEADIDIMASRRASTTHHPGCNLAMRNGISPVYFLLKAGVNVALGIDDKGINDDDDPISELRLVHRLHRVSGFDLAGTPQLDAFDVLRMGTANAARVCGFEGEIGALKPGMKADAILIDLEEIMNDPWTSPDMSIADLFIQRAKGTNVNTVIVGGKVVIEDRKFLTIDIDSLYEEARRQTEKGIGTEQTEFAETLQRIKPYYQKWYAGWERTDCEPFYMVNSRV